MAKPSAEPTTTRLPTRQMWRRSLLVLTATGVLMCALIGRLAYLQIIQNDEWAQRAVSQQLSDSLTSAHRGAIYDCNGNVLAESMQVWTVIMSPNNIRSEDTRQLIADDLSELLGVDRDTLYEKTTRTYSQYERVIQKCERPLIEKLIAWVDGHELSGSGIFRIIPDYKRTYPYGSLLSSVIGFTGTDYYGLYGLEAKYDKTLSGVAGRIVTAQNGVGGDMPVSLTYEKTVDAEDGNSLVLTIDQTIQHYAEKYLDTAVRETGATNRGVCIVMQVKTGAILAMAVKGDFDPNQPMEITDPTTLEQLSLLSGDAYSDALIAARQKQWVNKAVSDYYEPGSVFKMFTASMAVEEGIQPTADMFYCPGYVVVSGEKISCWNIYGHGNQSFADIISHSCNPAFVKLGQAIGTHKFFKYFVGFGFTEPTGIDMLSEFRVTSALYHGDDMTVLDVSTSSMGQTFKITPIQMITAISAVANGGYLMQPYVVQQIVDPSGNVVSTTSPTVKRQVISTETSRTVTGMLAEAVKGGGSKNVYVAGYRVAGKSGTSDKTETLAEHNVWASFGCFAPSDDPEIAVLTIVDEPHSSNRYGSAVSGPVCQKVLAETLPYLGIEPQYTEEELANLSTVTPNVTNKEVSVATATLTNSELSYSVVGSGQTVIRQIPEAGSTIPKGGMVVLYTDEDSVDTTTTVPNFEGLTLSQANAAAAAARLNLQISGIGLDSGEAVVRSQSIVAGEAVKPGTVLQVTFIYEDTIE